MMTTKDFEAKQIIFIFLQPKEIISFQNDNILIKTADRKIKYQITCYRIFALFVVGHFVLTSGLIQRSHKFGFPIFLMTNGLKLYESFGGHMEGNLLLRKHQYEYQGLDLGKHILMNKVKCQRENLNLQRDKSEELKKAIAALDRYIKEIEYYQGNLEGLLGLEGSAARIYFKQEFNNVQWGGRKPRIKNDYINSTLDIGYTVLFNFMDALLRIYGFDTYCGVLHRQFYMRKSLVCDVMEPFRAIVDHQIRKSINLQQCAEEDFQLVDHRYLLKWKENQKYIQFLMKGILQYKMDIFVYVQQFYRAFMKQKDAKDYPVFEMIK